MQNKLFLKAADICELLEVKQTSAYEIIGNLNKELEEQGYLTLRGKVNNPVPVSLLSGDRKPQIRFLGNHHSGSGNLYHKSFRM